MADINQLTKAIETWARRRGLDKGDPAMQYIKFAEEGGELARALVRQDRDLIEDSFGDTYITLVILAKQLGLDMSTCVNKAYSEIADRAGEMRNGVFVKEADL